MAIYEFEGRAPKIGANSFVHPEAVLIGDVEIGSSCYIGATAVLRGDYGKIVVGDGTNVQDGCVIHTEPDTIAQLGNNCLIGHKAMLHGPMVMHDRVMVAMSATVLENCELCEDCVVAACSMVKKDTVVPPGKVVMGIPAQVKGDVSEYAALFTKLGVELYQGLAVRSLKDMKRIG